MGEPIIEAQHITKTYNMGESSEVHVLKDITLTIQKGEFVAIMGPSGSGKTTMLDILGCLLRPTSGKLLISGADTSRLNDHELAQIRGNRIGFIFQQYNLIPSSTALDNVELAMRINGKNKREARKRATDLLAAVGLGERMDHLPSELSGGEQQRVAIARALSNDPHIILADEPTGNLDTINGNKILDLLKKLNVEKGYTIVLISHDPHISSTVQRIILLRDGEIVQR